MGESFEGQLDEINVVDQEEPALGYSAVIPVYNSQALVGEVIDRTIDFFEQNGLNYELILVNDGSRDNSWEIVIDKASHNPHIIAINLLKNYGQHTAVFCGFKHSSGDYVITLDDDLQNPPEEMVHLIAKANEGYDLVFGKFHTKQHARYRRIGSRIIGLMNEKIFNKPEDLTVTNFRIIRSDVIARICAYRTGYPYITGLTLMFSSNPANTWVEHLSRPAGSSNYNWYKLAELVMRILFNYSSFPLRVVSLGGILMAFVSFLIGGYVLIRALLVGFTVPGWATVMVTLSFFMGLILVILAMLGEYTVRLLQQISVTDSYHVKEIVGEQT